MCFFGGENGLTGTSSNAYERRSSEKEGMKLLLFKKFAMKDQRKGESLAGDLRMRKGVLRLGDI